MHKPDGDQDDLASLPPHFSEVAWVDEEEEPPPDLLVKLSRSGGWPKKRFRHRAAEDAGGHRDNEVAPYGEGEVHSGCLQRRSHGYAHYQCPDTCVFRRRAEERDAFWDRRAEKREEGP